MAITEILGTDLPSDSRTVINDNFTDLDTTKADLASPTFTGTPTLPTGTTAVTQAANDNSTKVATTAYADAAVVNSSFPATQVFNSTSPTTWTDLDLSSVIGTNQKVVLLKINNTGASSSVFFRRKGDTDDSSTSLPASVSVGASAARASANTFVSVIAPTDVNGVIQWETSAAAAMTIDIEAYW